MGDRCRLPSCIKLSSTFLRILQPIKVSSLIYDPGIFFASSAYWNFLQELGNFLSLLESMLPIDAGQASGSNSSLEHYAASAQKSIKTLKNSLWFLYLAPAVEFEKKHPVFQYGIGIFEGAVVGLDEIVNIFLNDGSSVSRLSDLQESLLRLYSCSSQVPLPTNFT